MLQFPLGEVWLVFHPSQAQGRVVLATGRSAVRDGRLVDTTYPHPMVELGLGLNPRARRLPGTSLFEKALGSVHIGLGDAALIGGTVVDTVHYDLPLARGAVVSGLPDPATWWDEEGVC